MLNTKFRRKKYLIVENIKILMTLQNQLTTTTVNKIYIIFFMQSLLTNLKYLNK